MSVRSAWFQKLAERMLAPGQSMSAEEIGACEKTLLIEMSWELMRRARSAKISGEALEWLEFLGFALNNRQGNGQLLQDLWVVWESRKKPQPYKGYFVEFGACDGKNISNTYLLEHEFGWSGIVAEPNPAFHTALRRNRSCVVSTKCVYSASGLTVPFRLVERGEYSGLVQHLADDRHAAKREGGGTVTFVETISLSDLLDENGAPDVVDYLSIDTEGSELEILSGYPFAARPIRLITVEHNGTMARQRIYDLLASKGYRRKFAGFSRWDDWYVLESAIPLASLAKQTKKAASKKRPAHRGSRKPA